MAKRIRLVEKRPVICHEAGLIRLVVCDLSSLFSHYSVPLLSPQSSSQWWWRNGRLFLVLWPGPPKPPVFTCDRGPRYLGSVQPRAIDTEAASRKPITVIVSPSPLSALYHTALCCAGGAYLPCLGWLAGVIGLCIFFIVMPLIRAVCYRGFKKDHVTTNSSSLSYSNTGYQYKYLFNFFHFYWIRPCFV